MARGDNVQSDTMSVRFSHDDAQAVKAVALYLGNQTPSEFIRDVVLREVQRVIAEVGSEPIATVVKDRHQAQAKQQQAAMDAALAAVDATLSRFPASPTRPPGATQATAPRRTTR